MAPIWSRLAAPVGQMDDHDAMAPHLKPGTIVTDAGSTKRDVVDAVHRHFGAVLPDVVPAHPIAGAEKKWGRGGLCRALHRAQGGADAAAREPPWRWRRCAPPWPAGAVVVGMTPQEHDRVFAAVSHLPHLLAFGLVDDLAGRSNAPLLFSHAASGFATSPASPAVTLRCGATSASPTGCAARRSSTPIRPNSRACA